MKTTKNKKSLIPTTNSKVVNNLDGEAVAKAFRKASFFKKKMEKASRILANTVIPD